MTSPQCLIELEGEWDIARRDELSALIDRAVDSCAVGAVVVDLRRTTFVDSSALSLLVNLHNRMRTEDRRLVTLCPREGAVRRTIELLELGERLGVIDAGDDHQVA